MSDLKEIQETFNKEVQRRMKLICEKKEELMEAFIAQYGCKPDEAVMLIHGDATFIQKQDVEQQKLIQNWRRNQEENFDVIERNTRLSQQLEICFKAFDKINTGQYFPDEVIEKALAAIKKVGEEK